MTYTVYAEGQAPVALVALDGTTSASFAYGGYAFGLLDTIVGVTELLGTAFGSLDYDAYVEGGLLGENVYSYASGSITYTGHAETSADLFSSVAGSVAYTGYAAAVPDLTGTASGQFKYTGTAKATAGRPPPPIFE